MDSLQSQHHGYQGHLLWNPDDLLTLTNFAVRRGWKIGIYAIGERAHRTLLDVYEQGIKENPGLKPGTLVLEHGFLADAGQRARTLRLGIPVTIQHPLLYTLGPMLLDGWAILFLMRSLVVYPHGMLAERDRLRKQEERKVSLVFGLKKGKVNILHPQPRHPCLEGDKAVDCLALFCYTIGAGKPASFKPDSSKPDSSPHFAKGLWGLA